LKGEVDMATFFMFGEYTTESLKEISAERTLKGAALVKKFGGEIKSGYALLGKHDLVLIVEFPNAKQAMKASVAMTKLLGISFSTAPAVTMEKFDQMMEEV
jgi:uncharacterized protein with GYD domain